MSLDARLRDGLASQAAVVPDRVTEERAASAVASGRRRRRRRRVEGVAGGLALATIIGLVVSSAMIGGGRSSPTPASRPDALSAVAGTYEIDLPRAVGVVERFGLTGTWLVELTRDGEMVLAPPEPFEGGVSGIAFEVDGSTFRTNAFSNSSCSSLPAGEYRWTRDGDRLLMTPLDEPCALRAALFGSRPWIDVG